jgi:ketosteroid isomerase-like protein
MAEHALPPSDKHPLLSWQPTFADISRAGDIGYTTGPWQFKNDVRDAEATAFGNFLTVWKRQADDSWKFVIDLGITNPAPAQRPSEWTPQSGNRSSSSTTSVSVAEETSKLLALEREFSQSSARDGALRAFRSRASERVRVFRNGQQPAVGKQSALALLPSRDVIWTWEPAYADVSKSGDLAYSYGTYRIAGAAAASNILESGNYYRIWKKEGKTWKVATDLLDPVKEAKQN